MNASLQIGFLTGQSNPHSCALSPIQHAFLSQVATPDVELLDLNFPYRHGPCFTPTPLWQASINNLKQYLLSRKHEYGTRHRSDVVDVINKAHHTVFLAGSCGLELFTNLHLSAEAMQRCTLIAFGPVTRQVPAGVRVIIAQGTRDLLSRFFVSRCDHPLECSHLDYLTNPTFVRLCQDIIQQEFSKLPCNSTSV